MREDRTTSDGPVPRHTQALTYSRWERLHFMLFGHWPQRVVDRRLEAWDRDLADLRRRHEAILAMREEDRAT